MDFSFPKSPFPQDLGCFVVMEILWLSSLVIFLECEKYLSNVIGLINVKCRLCNFPRFYLHIVFGTRVYFPPNISIEKMCFVKSYIFQVQEIDACTK